MSPPAATTVRRGILPSLTRNGSARWLRLRPRWLSSSAPPSAAAPVVTAPKLMAIAAAFPLMVPVGLVVGCGLEERAFLGEVENWCGSIAMTLDSAL